MATAACAVSGTVQGAAFGGASTKIWNYEKRAILQCVS